MRLLALICYTTCCKGGLPRLYTDVFYQTFFCHRFVHQAYELVCQHLSDLVDHLEYYNVDVPAWLARNLQNGFSMLLPFDIMSRLFVPFLFGKLMSGQTVAVNQAALLDKPSCVRVPTRQ